MVVKMGSEESSSMLWVHTGGKDCRCRKQRGGGGSGEDSLLFLGCEGARDLKTLPAEVNILLTAARL